MAIELTANDEAVLLKAVRQVGEANTDAAFAFAADRIRHKRYPDIAGVAAEIVDRWAPRRVRR